MNLEQRFTDKQILSVAELENLIKRLIREKNNLREQLANAPSGGCQEHEEIMREIMGH